MVIELLRNVAHFIIDAVFSASVFCLVAVILLLGLDKVPTKWKDYYIWGMCVVLWVLLVLLLR